MTLPGEHEHGHAMTDRRLRSPSYKTAKLRNVRDGMSGGDVILLEDRITILGLEGRRLRSAPFCCNVWA